MSQARSRPSATPQEVSSPPAPFPHSPPALTLVSATYDDALVRLTFDRPIDIADFVPGQIVPRDGMFNMTAYEAAMATLEDPTTVLLTLEPTGPYEDPDVMLSATALSGIVATDDGGTWPGVLNVPLPFP